MNIKPRLDKDIPKGYLYLNVPNSRRSELALEELKSKKDKKSMKKKSELREGIVNSKELLERLQSGEDINLYSSKLTVSDFTRSSSNHLFDNNYVVKIDPVCMFKTWQTYGRDTYDLYSFKAVDIFTDKESLMKSLKKDRLLSDYVLSYYLNTAYGNKEYIDIRNNFIDYVIQNYPDNRPSFANILKRFKAKDYESSATYKVDEYKIKYYREAYDKGFIRLNEDYETEATFVFLLKNRMFDLLPQAIDGLNEYGKSALLEFGDKYSTYESVKCIKEELMNNLDNGNCKMMYDLCGFKSPGYRLTVIEEDTYEGDDIIDDKTFDTVDELKKYLIRNYDCDMSRVYNGQFEDLYVQKIGADDYYKRVEVEYVE